ncbi:hypothetical protein Tsp_03508 [Trichinella spiralis]|uniref:hypothetical protein n=1 Tax=Trichinella spiralis TaxID=6334 RepID=UPI0001EFB416|nr:hypothetical protein Tsp_03508 [Trichinella spiralis]
MVVRWAGRPYTTLKALWDERIQQWIDDGMGAGGYRWPNDKCKDCRGGLQHENGGLTGVGRAYRYNRVTDEVVRRYIIENKCWMGGTAVYHSECIVGEVERGYTTINR